jgi:DNA-binding MarR family transcriptional regulator
MTTKLKTEIKQNRPFETPAHEAWVGIERTASLLSHSLERALKPFGITPTQFNVLRILRGALPNGLCRNDVRDRLIAQVPDTTRLLDRTEQAGLVDRIRSVSDRRYVMTRITKKGLALLDRVDPIVADEVVGRLRHMSANELETLNNLLTQIRETETEPATATCNRPK